MVDFVMDLYRLAEHCSYGVLHNEMVRDRIVVGLRDAKLSEKLQMDSDLDLDKAIAARQSESVKQQQPLLRNTLHDEQAVNMLKKRRQSHPNWRSKRSVPPQKPQSNLSCSRCGMSGCFKGLRKLEGEYTIKLMNNAKPYALTTPRHVAIPLLPRVKVELERMERMGVIRRVGDPTDWCAGMVIVPKSGECVKLTCLNENVCKERHPLPAIEQTLAQLAGTKVFTKLDTNSGFWQIPLAEKSSLLTTFIIPFGRFCFNRLYDCCKPWKDVKY